MNAKGPGGLKLGSDIEIYCRYCRLNLDAVVSAFGTDGGIAKVQCRTCMHFQDYKPPRDVEDAHRKLVAKAMRIAEKHTRGPQGGDGGPARASGMPAASDMSQVAVMRRLWEEATADVSPGKMKMYDKHRAYHKDDIISHKAHGLGVVVRDDVEGTVTVLFRDQVLEIECDVPRDE